MSRKVGSIFGVKRVCVVKLDLFRDQDVSANLARDGMPGKNPRRSFAQMVHAKNKNRASRAIKGGKARCL